MSKAYDSGVMDGREWARDQRVDHEGVELASGLNRDGSLASEALLNACAGKVLAGVLGLTIPQLEQTDAAFCHALADYDRGWDAAIGEAIKAEQG